MSRSPRQTMMWWLAPALLLAVGFGRLGVWQLDRAAEKERLLADFDAAANAPLRLDRWQSQPRYTRVLVTGRFRPAPLILMDNQVHEGQVGVHVLQVFDPAAGGDSILVDRGWSPLGADRQPPQVAARADAVDLEGLVSTLPQPAVRLGEVAIEAGDEPQRVPWLDIDDLSQALKSPLASQILLSSDDRDTALVQAWRPQVMPADKHRAYAFQWFCLAATVLIVWAVMARRATTKTHDRD